MTEAQVKGLFHKRCPKFVRDAEEILEKLLVASEEWGEKDIEKSLQHNIW